MKGILKSKLILALAALLMIVSAIAISLSGSITHTHAAPTDQTTTISIPATQAWTDTGIDLTVGSSVSITASGTIYIAGSDPGKTPDGDPTCTAWSSFIAPGLHCWSLIGNIANGTPFQVGSSTNFSSAVAGRLYLGVNDEVFGDNSGSWSASITLVSPSPSVTPSPTSTPDSRNKLFVFVQGINSTLSAQDAIGGYIPQDSFGASGGIYEYLKSTYPDSQFLMFSYAGSDDGGYPQPYYCQDTFTKHLNIYVDRLRSQINKYITRHANTDVYIIGHSMGGAVAFGLLAQMELKGFMHSHGGRIAGVTTLDSPLGGTPGGFINSYFAKRYFLGACPALNSTPQLPLNSLHDLFAIFNTSNSTPHGGMNSIMHTLFGGSLTNQQVADAAKTQLVSTLTIANGFDWIYTPQACTTLPAPDDFSSTEWLTDEGDSSGVYGREFIGGEITCPDFNHIADNHAVVFTEASVQTGLMQFIDGSTPSDLQPAPL